MISALVAAVTGAVGRGWLRVRLVSGIARPLDVLVEALAEPLEADGSSFAITFLPMP